MARCLADPSTAPGTTWTESVIHSFAGDDGSSPNALALDAKGVLYGTTNYGGTSGNGTVFTLAPPAVHGARWNLTVLHNHRRCRRQFASGLTIGSKGSFTAPRRPAASSAASAEPDAAPCFS